MWQFFMAHTSCLVFRADPPRFSRAEGQNESNSSWVAFPLMTAVSGLDFKPGLFVFLHTIHSPNSYWWWIKGSVCPDGFSSLRDDFHLIVVHCSLDWRDFPNCVQITEFTFSCMLNLRELWWFEAVFLPQWDMRQLRLTLLRSNTCGHSWYHLTGVLWINITSVLWTMTQDFQNKAVTMQINGKTFHVFDRTLRHIQTHTAACNLSSYW